VARLINASSQMIDSESREQGSDIFFRVVTKNVDRSIHCFFMRLIQVVLVMMMKVSFQSVEPGMISIDSCGIDRCQLSIRVQKKTSCLFICSVCLDGAVVWIMVLFFFLCIIFLLEEEGNRWLIVTIYFIFLLEKQSNEHIRRLHRLWFHSF
jgi:hypothetical protein